MTGASSGIGAAIATELNGRGLEVHAIARREARLADLNGCIPHALDIRDTTALNQILKKLT